MKAIFKGNKFAIQWTIKNAVTSLPFDFTGMFVEYILYSDSYKGRIVGATTNINKMQAEIPANILPVGVYNIICKYRNSINEGQCLYRNAFQITRNPEFIECDNIVVIESFSAPLKLENMDINYLGHFTSSDLLIDCNQPSWALVGKLNEAEPWFFYTEDAIPAGSQYGWNNMSDILGKYNLLTSSKEVYHTTLFDRFISYQQIDGASVTKEDTTEINNIIEAIKTNKSVSFYYNQSKTTFNYFGTLDCYFNETETEFGCYIPTEDGYVVARCNLSNPNQWSLVRGQSTGEGTSVTNYNQLKERPSINGVTLTGNHNPAELDLATVTQFNQVKDISNHALDVSNQSDRKSGIAVNTADQADTKADGAINTAEEAKSTAELARTAVRTLEGLANATEAQQVLAAQVVQIEENKQNIASNKAETDEKITELASEIKVSTEDDDNIDGMNVCDEKGQIILSLVNGHVKTKEFDSKKISNLEIMGKNLIIKNADFSSVAIGNTVVGGKNYLTPSNYAERRICYLYNPNSDFRNFTWSTGVDNIETDGVNFYPILKGEVVKIPCDTESMIRACLCDAPMGNVIIGAMVNTPIEGKSIMFRAGEDCYVGIKNNIPVFPDNSYIENYSNISSRLINKDTYERAVSYFFDDNSLPIWGGEVSSLVYHVFKGETITVKAKSSKGASLALIKQSEESGKSISTSWWANDNINDCKISLNAGETKSFTVPEDCVMYVLSHDVLDQGDGYYPESITLTPVANN